MPRHVALLRAVNLGSHNKVAMSDLRELAAGLGFTGAATVLQSGNLVFEGARLTGQRLECLLEQETARRLGVSTRREAAQGRLERRRGVTAGVRAAVH